MAVYQTKAAPLLPRCPVRWLPNKQRFNMKVPFQKAFQTESEFPGRYRPVYAGLCPGDQLRWSFQQRVNYNIMSDEEIQASF